MERGSNRSAQPIDLKIVEIGDSCLKEAILEIRIASFNLCNLPLVIAVPTDNYRPSLSHGEFCTSIEVCHKSCCT